MKRELHIFDMDGTLVDTYAATIAAYQRAAAELNMAHALPHPVSHIWGRTASEWRCPAELHQRKIEIYKGLVHAVLPGWAARYYFQSRKDGHTNLVWTGASQNTVNALCTVPDLRLLLDYDVYCSRSADWKARQLRLLCEENIVHYYDDDLSVALCVIDAKIILHLNRREPCE